MFFSVRENFQAASKLPLSKQKLAKNMFKAFYSVRSAKPPEQKRIGLAVLQRALADPGLQMEINREIKIALDNREAMTPYYYGPTVLSALPPKADVCTALADVC